MNEIEIAIAAGQPALGAKAIRSGNAFAQLIDVTALAGVDGRRIVDGRLAPRLPAGGGVDRTFLEKVIESIPELLANVPRRDATDQRMLRVLGRGVGRHCELGDSGEQLVRRVLATELANGGPNGGLVAFEERLEEIHWLSSCRVVRLSSAF